MTNDELMTKREMARGEQGAAVSSPPRRMTTAMIECRAPKARSHSESATGPHTGRIRPQAKRIRRGELGATPQDL